MMLAGTPGIAGVVTLVLFLACDCGALYALEPHSGPLYPVLHRHVYCVVDCHVHNPQLPATPLQLYGTGQMLACQRMLSARPQSSVAVTVHTAPLAVTDAQATALSGQHVANSELKGGARMV